jgi:cytochrome c551/c552
VPAVGVIPFEVTSPLFTDGALKRRFVTLTKGGTIDYSNDTTRWQSPVGTIYVKTFAYPPNLTDPETDGLEQLIETRLIAHVAAEDDRLECGGAPSCWQVHVYVYTEDMTDAVCQAGGATVSVEYTDPVEKECSGSPDPCDLDEDCPVSETCENVQESVPNYGVPSNGACRRCHGTDVRTLGPSAGMFNRGNDYGGNLVANQIDQLYGLGMLAPEPPPEDLRTTYVDPVLYTEECSTPECSHEAARSYLDANCAHCHAPDGEASGSGVYLDYASMAPTDATLADFRTWGVCKVPTSAGNVMNCGDALFDIVPGDPDSSILLCRINSVTPGEMMAPLGRSLVDDDGYEVIRRWITDLPILFGNIPLCDTGAPAP